MSNIGDPNVAQARTILDRVRVKQSERPEGVDSVDSTEGDARAALKTELRDSLLAATTVFGSDNRATVTNTTVNPYSAQVAQSYNITPITYFGCSATLIGNRTAVSAAHCFHTGVGGSWRPTYSWAVGARATYTANPLPYGSHYGCYQAYIPAAYITTNSSSIYGGYNASAIHVGP